MIKARNKPKNPVTKPESAPFFLPSLSSSLPSQYASNTKGSVEIKFQLGEKFMIHNRTVYDSMNLLEDAGGVV